MDFTLICLPFAGGSRYSLYFLKKVLPTTINCFFCEYPGRGTRIKEEFSEDIHDLVNDLYASIVPLLNKPYAIYGHSMGAKIAYLLAQKIKEEGKVLPRHLFVSGTDGPSVPSKIAPRFSLPKDEFIEAVKELGGFPDEFLQSDELMQYFEPILRADFKISETYQYEKKYPLPIPITVMVGDKEDMEEEDIRKWQNETIKPIKIYKFEGDHFFIYKHEQEIGRIIESSF